MAQVRRPRVPRRRIVLVALALVVAAAVVAGALLLPTQNGVLVERGSAQTAATSESAAQTSDAAVTAATSSPAVVVVHVDGAVVTPGVYELRLDAPRVRDAVSAAGGLADDADTSSVNLAAVVPDGQKVHIPAQGETVASGADSSSGAEASSASGDSTSTGLVNINTATAEELDALPGVGPSTAAAIIEERESGGPFSSVEDLMRVSGIGEKKFAKIRDHICV